MLRQIKSMIAAHCVGASDVHMWALRASKIFSTWEWSHICKGCKSNYKSVWKRCTVLEVCATHVLMVAKCVDNNFKSMVSGVRIEKAECNQARKSSHQSKHVLNLTLYSINIGQHSSAVDKRLKNKRKHGATVGRITHELAILAGIQRHKQVKRGNRNNTKFCYFALCKRTAYVLKQPGADGKHDSKMVLDSKKCVIKFW